MIKHMKNFVILISFLILISAISVSLNAQNVEKDSIPQTKEVKNRNVMLNASDDNQPRQISIGLPETLSATIFEDGLPVSYNIWPCLPYLFWTNTTAHEYIGVMSLGESAITSGAINYGVQSSTRTAGEKFESHVNYVSNTNFLQRFDLSIAGPIKNGWSYSLGSYANMDPGSNKLADTKYATDMKILRAGLTKVWGDGKGIANLFYRHSRTKSLTDNNGPFVYVGDGSVDELDNFDLGKDGFLPANGEITYTDVMTGETKTIIRSNDVDALNNSLTFNLDYRFDNEMNLKVISKYNYANSYMASLNLSGIDEANETSGYTYAYDSKGHKAGDIFTGYYNSRYILRDIGYERDWLTTVELMKQAKNHSWRIGANFFWNQQGLEASTGVLAHTVEADPVWLLHDGSQVYTPNTGGEYYDTHETKFALYASDDWQINDRLFLSAGFRAEYYSLGGKNAVAYLNANDTVATYPENIRDVGYNLANGRITSMPNKHWFNPSGTINGRYTIIHGFGILGEYVYSMQHPNSQDFAGPYNPIYDAVNIHLGRAGLFWNTSWMQLVSQFSIISQDNYKSRTQFTNPDNASDVITLPITYDIQTMGWTTDIVVTPFKGFMFHGLLTIQDPKYKNFIMKPTFRDGTSLTYDFGDKVTTGVSKTIVELDPSYSFDKFRIWASIRYQSKQYINKTNSLYFNGRWETFGGIDYKVNDMLSFSVNFVNILNTKGADGSISSADLIEDASSYKNYLMAGTYIRPFTVEFSTRINF